MTGRHPFQRYPEAHTAPSQNLLLAALPDDEYERLLPYLEPRPLAPGLVLHEAGDREEALYFVTAGIVARDYVMENGSTATFAVTGREGVIGIASFLGGRSTPARAAVLIPGQAYRLGVNVLRSEFARVGALQHLLLNHVGALIAQTTQTAACNRHHAIEQQLCRWILACVDRLGSCELAITQEHLAELLGVRRESVAKADADLQKEGLIHYRRGHIKVLDRARLEARACECYGVLKREYARLLSAALGRPAGRQPIAVPQDLSGRLSLAPLAQMATQPRPLSSSA